MRFSLSHKGHSKGMSNTLRNRVTVRAKRTFVKLAVLKTKIFQGLTYWGYCVKEMMELAIKERRERDLDDSMQCNDWGVFIRMCRGHKTQIHPTLYSSEQVLAASFLFVTIVLGQYVFSVSIEPHFSGELCCEFVNGDSHLVPFESQFHLQWVNTHILYPSRPIDYILSPAISLTRK